MAEPDDSQKPDDSSPSIPDDDIEALLAQAESLASDLAEETDVGPEERIDPPDAIAGSVTGADTLGAVEQATGDLDEIDALLREAEAQVAGVFGPGDAPKVEEEFSGAATQEEQDGESSVEATSAEESSDEVSADAESENEEEKAGKASVSDVPSESGLKPDSSELSDLVGDPDVDLSEPGENEAQEAVQAAAEVVEKEAKAGDKRAEASAKEKLEPKPVTGAKDSARKDGKDEKGDDAAKDDGEKGEAAPKSLKTRLVENCQGAIPVVVELGRHAVVTTRRVLQNAVLGLFVILDKPFAKLSPNAKKYVGLVGLVTVVMGGLMWVLPKLLESNPYLDMPPFPPVEPK